MENLINDLLDLAKFENNQFKLDVEYFNLSIKVHEALQIILNSANDKKIQIKVEIDNLAHMPLIQ